MKAKQYFHFYVSCGHQLSFFCDNHFYFVIEYFSLERLWNVTHEYFNDNRVSSTNDYTEKPRGLKCPI